MLFISFTLFLLLFPFPWECFIFFLFLFLFLFCLIHFISFFFFSVLSLLVLFFLGGSFVLVQAKQVMGFYRVFIIKIGEGGVCTTRNAIMKKDE